MCLPGWQSLVERPPFTTNNGQLINSKPSVQKVAGKKGTGLKAVVLSTLSAAFGVQKKANLEKDFQQGKPAHFIIAGIVGTALFVAALLLVVYAVLGKT